MEKIRLNKYLASLGIGSRREIDLMVIHGKIRVNGEIPSSGLKVDENDIILVNDKKIYKKKTKKVYFLLNKPINTLSSVKDDRGRTTVVDIINTKERIFPIGRLDYRTTGLLILTNDGELFNRLIHPRSQVYKKYQVEINGILDNNQIEILQKGILLDDGLTLPAAINVIFASRHSSILKISIREGRNRQVRRMINTLGYDVLSLRREKIGELSIDGLKEGEYRELTKKEVEYLYSL